ncbi:hypothetical protein KFU94_19605 [Chloroflexi bacterium TSY]|nr:hypothetical protein [Chloroflexi bacterium TSY]
MTWSEPRPVTNLSGDLHVSDWDMIVDTNGQIVLPWVRYSRSTLSQKSDLILSTSLDGGQNFATVQVEDEQGKRPATSEQRHIAVTIESTGNETRAWLAWQDDRNHPKQIWSAHVRLDSSPPTAPGNVQATPADGAIRLTWTSSSDESGIRGYRVFRGVTRGGPYSEITRKFVEGNSFVDVELDNARYFYQLVAIDGNGIIGPRSGEADAAADARGTDLPFSGTIVYEINKEIRARTFANLGMEQTLAAGRKPHFSNDGANLYYYDDAAIRIRSMSTGSTGTFVQHDKLLDYDIATNAQYFASTVGRQFVTPNVIPGVCRVAEPHFGTALQMLVQARSTLGNDIALSADQHWLVYRNEGFCNNAGFGVYEPANVCIVNLINNTKDCLQGADYRNPDFAPNGHTLAFSANLTGQREIWLADVANDGNLHNYRQLTNGPAGQPSLGPSWSTTGEWIIFQRHLDTGENANWRLFVVKADGTTLRALNVTGQAPAWSNRRTSTPVDPAPTSTVVPTTNPTVIPTSTPELVATPTPDVDNLVTEQTFLPLVQR